MEDWRLGEGACEGDLLVEGHDSFLSLSLLSMPKAPKALNRRGGWSNAPEAQVGGRLFLADFDDDVVVVSNQGQMKGQGWRLPRGALSRWWRRRERRPRSSKWLSLEVEGMPLERSGTGGRRHGHGRWCSCWCSWTAIWGRSSLMLLSSRPSSLDVTIFKTARLGDNCTANDEQ